MKKLLFAPLMHRFAGSLSCLKPMASRVSGDVVKDNRNEFLAFLRRHGIEYFRYDYSLKNGIRLFYERYLQLTFTPDGYVSVDAYFLPGGVSVSYCYLSPSRLMYKLCTLISNYSERPYDHYAESQQVRNSRQDTAKVLGYRKAKVSASDKMVLSSSREVKRELV